MRKFRRIIKALIAALFVVAMIWLAPGRFREDGPRLSPNSPETQHGITFVAVSRTDSDMIPADGPPKSENWMDKLLAVVHQGKSNIRAASGSLCRAEPGGMAVWLRSSGGTVAGIANGVSF